MQRNNFLSLIAVGLLSSVLLLGAAFATPQAYVFTGIGLLQSSKLSVNAPTSSEINLPSEGGWNQLTYRQRYDVGSTPSQPSMAIGMGIQFNPLFASNILASNALELAIATDSTNTSITRYEDISTNGGAFQNSYTIPLSIKQHAIRASISYVMNSQPIWKKLSVFTKIGVGLAQQSISSSENIVETAVVGNENFTSNQSSALANASLGVNFQLTHDLNIRAGYAYQFNFNQGEVSPKWIINDSQSSITQAMLNKAAAAVKLKTGGSQSQLFAQLIYHF